LASNLDDVFEILKEVTGSLQEPVVSRVAHELDPFQVLISTMLSLRTKDAVTEQAFKRLFSLAPSPEQIILTDLADIENAIFPVGFYRTKAVHIKEASIMLMERYHGKVPENMEDLLTLPGVGRKTANLVMILGYGKPGICVDTHVHRITNRWGYVYTKNPDETELRLRRILPQKYWMKINDYLVTYGQNICVPVSPFCTRCRIRDFCARLGVDKSR